MSEADIQRIFETEPVPDHILEKMEELRKKGKSKDNQDRDKMIAAHARAKEYILVTDNTKDFEDIDNLQLCNWREKEI